jgi:restriction system protein
MKLKMAKNSLFAVLLRSPWWISMLLVLAFGLASAALLPKAYVPFGVMGALPFFVIGLMALQRQWNVPSAARVAELLERAAALPWRDFADSLDAAYRAQGHRVTRLNVPAADLQLEQAGRTTLVSAKRWKAANHGVEALRDLAAEKERRGAAACIYISAGAVSEKARIYAQEQGIELVSGAALAQLLAAAPD